MKRMTLVCLLTLFTEMQFGASQTETICKSPQYIELGKKGIITCGFRKDFFAVRWYSSIDFKNSHPTIQYQNKNKSGPGFESGEFDVYPNGSLIVTEVFLEHEDMYTVAYLSSKEALYDFINIQVIVIAPAYPAIDGCNDHAFCELQREYSGSLTCSVEGIRPQVELQWKTYYEDQSSLISFLNPRRMVKDNGGLFDVTLIVQYRVSANVGERLTVECRVVSTNDLLSNLTKKMDLLFSTELLSRTENPSTTRGVHQLASHGIPVWILVLVTLLMFLICGVVAMVLCRRTIQSNTGTRDEEEEDALLESSHVVKKDKFLKQLKETYMDLYNNVKPIPYVKDKMYCVNNVFVDRCITFKDPKGEWIHLETYQDMFSDPRIKSKRLLLEGDPGHGKSTVSLQYAYDWCNSIQYSPLKDVDIFLLLRLRQLGGISAIYRAIKQFLLPKDSSLAEGDIEDILLNSKSVIIIFDGFDEYPDQDSKTSDVTRIIARQMFQDFIVVLTTRSACLPQKYSPSTKRLKLSGFSKSARINYIKKAVVDDDQIVNEIEQYLENNPILNDLCQVPLLFVLFVHMTHENELFRNSKSVTTFFRHMISCLRHHLENKAEDENVYKYDVLSYKHRSVNIVAFKILNKNSKGMALRKDELCKDIGQQVYDLYKGMGIFVEEEVLHFIDKPLNSGVVQYITEVRFYHKIFCEWYAAHYLTDYIGENPNLDLKECLRNLHPVDVQYLYRFSSGLNSDCAKKIIHYLAEIEDGGKFAILCISEQTGKTDDIKGPIRQLCSKGVIISSHDSLLLQRSSMQLLAIAASYKFQHGANTFTGEETSPILLKIPIKLLQLHNCFKSVDFSKSTLNTTSGLVLSSEIPVEQLGLRLFNERTSAEGHNDILKFSSMCPSLRRLGLYGSPPPKSFTLESLSTLLSRNVKVKYYGPVSESPVYNLNLLTGQWERYDGDVVQCTDEDFEQWESDWDTVIDMDAEEFRKAIHGYRKKLSLTAAKGSALSASVNEDDNSEQREDDIDIMALLRLPRDRQKYLE